MAHIHLVNKLRRKLNANGRTLKWFIENYLKECHYQTIMQQINRFTTLQDYTITAIEKYLEEEK